MRLVLSTLALTLLMSACESNTSGAGSPATPTATPSTVVAALLVWTTWTADPKVAGGPEPGYRPALTGLTGHDVQSATPMIDNTGTSWVIYLVFTARGASLFSTLTQKTAAPCPNPSGNCPQRHLGLWLDLSQSDIDRWDDPSFVAQVSMPFDLACLAKPSAGVCAKFVSDPVTLEQIKSGQAAISGAFTREGAQELAASINALPR